MNSSFGFLAAAYLGEICLFVVVPQSFRPVLWETPTIENLMRRSGRAPAPLTILPRKTLPIFPRVRYSGGECCGGDGRGWEGVGWGGGGRTNRLKTKPTVYLRYVALNCSDQGVVFFSVLAVAVTRCLRIRQLHLNIMLW